MFPRSILLLRMDQRVLGDLWSLLQILAQYAYQSLSLSPCEMSFSGLKAISRMGSSSAGETLLAEQLGTTLDVIFGGVFQNSSLLFRASFYFYSRIIIFYSLRKVSSFWIVLTSLPLIGCNTNLQLESLPSLFLSLFILLIFCFTSKELFFSRFQRIFSSKAINLSITFSKPSNSNVIWLIAYILKYQVRSSLVISSFISKKLQKNTNLDRFMVLDYSEILSKVVFLFILYLLLQPNSKSLLSQRFRSSYLLMTFLIGFTYEAFLSYCLIQLPQVFIGSVLYSGGGAYS